MSVSADTDMNRNLFLVEGVLGGYFGELQCTMNIKTQDCLQEGALWLDCWAIEECTPFAIILPLDLDLAPISMTGRLVLCLRVAGKNVER